jgi:hypothetical protein
VRKPSRHQRKLQRRAQVDFVQGMALILLALIIVALPTLVIPLLP